MAGRDGTKKTTAAGTSAGGAVAKFDVRSWWPTGGISPDRTKLCRFVNGNKDVLASVAFERLTAQVLGAIGAVAVVLTGKRGGSATSYKPSIAVNEDRVIVVSSATTKGPPPCRSRSCRSPRDGRAAACASAATSPHGVESRLASHQRVELGWQA